jgi:HNH endonuclease
MPKPEYSGAWQRVRLTILKRDNYACQIVGPKCTHVATEVDHIVPVSRGGSWLDPSNLRAACKQCNVGRVDHRNSERWRKSSTRIVLVIGPPMSGKTQYVDDHRSPNDVVADYGVMLSAVGSKDDASSTFSALVARVRRGQTDARRVWITSRSPVAEDLFPHHEVVVLDPGQREVTQRVAAAPQDYDRDVAIDGIYSWYSKRNAFGHGGDATDTPSREW